MKTDIIDNDLIAASKNAAQYFKKKTEGGPAPDLDLFEFAYQLGAQAIRNTEVINDALYMLMVSDLSSHTFKNCADAVINSIRDIPGGHEFTGSIGHPPADCSDEEYLKTPGVADSPFVIGDVHMRNDTEVWGWLRFADSPIGKRARSIYAKGGRFSIRMAESHSGVEIIGWDLVN